MQSKVFFCKETFKDITERDGLDAKRFEFDGDMYLPFKDKFGFFIKKIQLDFKEEVIKFDGSIHNNFTLYIIRQFSSLGQTIEDKDFIKDFYTIKEFSFSHTNGLICGNCSKPIIADRIFYEIQDHHAQSVLKKKDFIKREIKILAHYTKMDKAIEFILPNNRLLLNELSKANDPFETKKNLIQFIQPLESNLSKEELDKGWIDNIRLVSAFDKIFRRVKYVSFSTSKPKEKLPFKLPAMWAHYGQNHKGICLVFDKNILYDLFQNQYLTDSKFRSSVNYKKLKSSIIPKLDDLKKAYEYLKQNKNVLFFKKDKDWKPESEFRFVLIKKEVENNLSFIENMDQALIAIILGIDFNPNYKCSVEKLRDSLPNKNIGLYQLSFDNGEFKLEDENGYNLLEYFIVEC